MISETEDKTFELFSIKINFTYFYFKFSDIWIFEPI